MTTVTVTVTTELTDCQAMALAQFVKRLTWSEMRACAIDDNETWMMKDAIQAQQKSLDDVASVLTEAPRAVLMYYIRTILRRNAPLS